MILPTLCKVGIETTMEDPEMTREYNMYTVLFKCNRCPCRFEVWLFCLFYYTNFRNFLKLGHKYTMFS